MVKMLGFAVTLFAFLVGSARGENWPRFRGPNGAGVANGQNLPLTFNKDQGILWKAPLPGTGNASPIVWDQRVFIHAASADGKERHLICLDTAKGSTIWTKSLPGGPATFRRESSLASSTPTTDGAMVYVAIWDGKHVHLVAYDFAGNQKWAKDLGRWTSQHGPGASPILYKDKVLFANDMDREDKDKNPVSRPSILYAFNKETGAIVWETPREAYRACYSAPFILERNGQSPELIVTSSTAITSYNPDDGKPNWAWHWKWTGKMPLRTICSTYHLEGMFFACSGDGGGDRHMSAIDLKGAGKDAAPQTVWENRKKFPYVPGLLSRGEHLYFVNDAGYAGCFHARSGAQVWFERLADATFNASPLLVDGKMIAVSVEGDVYVFAAEPTYQLLGKSSLGEMVRATPAVADGKMYIRGQRHLYCIGKKEPR